MFIRLGVPYSICCLIILAWSGERRSKKRSWIEHLTQYVTAETSSHQLFLLSDDNPETTDTKIDNIVRRIKSKVPTFHLRFQYATNETAALLNLLPVFKGPRSTTIYLIVTSLQCNSNLTLLSKPIDFLARLAPYKPRARCLIVLLPKKRTPSYEKFLREMWDKKFLDTTIFEIVQSTKNGSKLIQKTRPESRIVHTFSSFDNRYMRKNYSSNLEWFPQKIRDLHGWEMKIGFINSTPFVFNEKNLLGKTTTTVSESEVKVMSTISKNMNFKFRFQYYDELGRASCIRSNNTGLLKDLMNQNVNLSIHHMILYTKCIESFVELGTPINEVNVGIVIPIIPVSRVSFSTNWQLINVLLLVVLVTSLKVVPWLLRFDSRNWRLAYIVQLILGFCAPREPKKLAERIMFGSLLVMSTVYSSSIYTAFTGVTLRKTTELKITNLEELYDSDVITLIHPSFYRPLLTLSEGINRKILSKSIVKAIDSEECVEMCMKYRNVSCFIGSIRPPLAIQKYEKGHGHAGALILGSFVPTTWNRLYFESTSPYVERFDEITRILRQSGLLNKWLKGSQLSTKSRTSEIGIQDNFSSSQLLLILVFGYALSILVFIAEVLFHYTRK